MPVTEGFVGRSRGDDGRLPPGQFTVDDFPVLTAGPTPRVGQREWRLTVADETGGRTWDWEGFRALPTEQITADIHCVTHWSKLDTVWEGVTAATLFDAAGVRTDARTALVSSYGGYTTNVPVADLIDRVALVAFAYDGTALAAEHGGPARLLVPHLYLWKSAKWVNEIRVGDDDPLGFWERAGYHSYGDPWREQRYQGD